VTPDERTEVEWLFDRIRRAGPHERIALLAAIADPIVRAEVGSLIDAGRDAEVTTTAVISEAAAAADGVTGRTLGHFRISHLGLARAAARSGDMATALRAYQALLALWKDADASALLNDARKELSALQSATETR
jgi:hypothetical protein